MAIEVILVDDHSIVRQGIKSVLAAEGDIEIVAEASNGREAIELAKKKSPDVVVMDITLPLLNGLEASYHILKQKPSTKILILSMHDNRAFIEKALSYGAMGYLLKDSAIDEIARGIREVYAGKFFLSSNISSFVIQDYISYMKKTTHTEKVAKLTSREREIVQLIAEGLNNKEIASQLGLSLKTVLAHRNNIMRKLGIHNQAQLIRFAIREGIVSL